jgi:hypothetical protein
MLKGERKRSAKKLSELAEMNGRYGVKLYGLDGQDGVKVL